MRLRIKIETVAAVSASQDRGAGAVHAAGRRVSSVIPYVCDQFAMARLSRATFALLLALLPATATAIGIVVLGQVPAPLELAGVGLVIAGVAVHRAERLAQ
jgi:inner membrane transporter RhtA